MSSSGTADDGEQPIGLEAERLAFRRVGLVIHGLLVPGSEAVDCTVTSISDVAVCQIRVRDADGGIVDHPRPTLELLDAVDALRAAMYREGSGTWLTATWAVTVSGQVRATYEYDSRPAEWIAASAYAEDLARFPRDPEHVPEWMSELVESDLKDSQA